MAYEIFLRPKEADLSFDQFVALFSKRESCRMEDDRAIYENANTGVGFYFEYMYEEKSGEPNVRSDGIYRIALCVDYCQPAFFFVEALYEIHDLAQHEDFVVYDPQLGDKPGNWPFNDRKMFDNWTQCNEEKVLDYIMSLGIEDARDIPVMPYEAIQKVWEWNYSIERLREMLDSRIQIPTIQSVEFAGEDLIGVIWKEGSAIVIPYVDVIIFARRKKGAKADSEADEDFEFCAVDYEEVKPYIEKYSERSFANAFLLDYEETPKELLSFIASLDPREEFTLMDMCDIIEYEVAVEAVMPGSMALGQKPDDKKKKK